MFRRSSCRTLAGKRIRFVLVGVLFLLVLSILFQGASISYFWQVSNHVGRKVGKDKDVGRAGQWKNLTREFLRINADDLNYSYIYEFHDRIDNIRLLGERHSGTTYLTRYLQNCFSEKHIKDYFIRKKHWFQPSPQTLLKAADIAGGEEALDQATKNSRFLPDYKSWWNLSHTPSMETFFAKSLVLLIVRDPYQWMNAMRLRPWHWPQHLKIFPKNETQVAAMEYNPEKQVGKRRMEDSVLFHRNIFLKQQRNRIGRHLAHGPQQIQKSMFAYEALSWSEFVNIPLYLQDEDSSLFTPNTAEKICSNGYWKGTLSPCVQRSTYVPESLRHIPRSFLRNLPYAANDAVYELQLNGKPFESALALRAAKIRNLLRIPDQWDVGGYAIIRYEDIFGVRKNSTAELDTLVRNFSRILQIESHCQLHTEMKKEPYILPPDYQDWINTHADWMLESRLGYTIKDKKSS